MTIMSQSKHMNLNLILGVVVVCIAAFALGAIVTGAMSGPEPCSFIGTWNGTDGHVWTFSPDGQMVVTRDGSLIFNSSYTVLSPTVVTLAPEHPGYVYIASGDSFSRVVYAGDGTAHRNIS